MIKVLATGVSVEDNFGAPSLLHGIQEVLTELYGPNYELVYYQTTSFNKNSLHDFDIKMLTVPLVFRDVNLSMENLKKIIELIRDIISSDIVVDLYGICFSDNLTSDRFKNSYMLSLINTLYKFRLIVLAKLFFKKTVKNTCSFGPMRYLPNKKAAAFTCTYLFNILSAREKESRSALISDAQIKKEILLSPDIANMMIATNNNMFSESKIGISTSYQIIKQWKGKDDYVECIVNLCDHINKKYCIPIILIPNEVQSSIDVNDVDVSNEIRYRLSNIGVDVEVIDSANMSSTDLKNIIASCEVMIASRYHSCVAALSSGIPTLVVGWHYKYEELLHWYGQDDWAIPMSECTSKKLISMFDSFWEQRDELKRIINEKYPEVRKAVIEIGKKLFSK